MRLALVWTYLATMVATPYFINLAPASPSLPAALPLPSSLAMPGQLRHSSYACTAHALVTQICRGLAPIPEVHIPYLHISVFVNAWFHYYMVYVLILICLF